VLPRWSCGFLAWCSGSVLGSPDAEPLIWIQTTVAKTEGADRPLRLNEVADLAKILGIRVPDMVSTKNDWELRVIEGQLERWFAHARRLNSEIGDLTQQATVKTQALEEAEKRIRELQAELAQLNG
jgi:hypothetical protein